MSVPSQSRTKLIVAGALLAFFVGFFFSLDLVPDLDSREQKLTLAGLLIAATPLAIGWSSLAERVRLSLLALLCCLAFGTMFRWSRAHVERYDHHDVICYYLGGKYAPELGPFDLYPAAVLADHQRRRWAKLDNNYWAQSVHGFERQPLTHALSRGREVRRQSFTKARWREFRADVLAFQKDMGRRRFRNFLVDKGFNATPAWIAYARPLIELVPVSQVRYLALLDALLLAGAFLFAATTFGSAATLWSIFFFCATISTKWLVPGGEILRYDWLSALIVALCGLRRGAYGLSGALTAVAGLLRVFPVVWIFGPGARLLYQLFTVPRDKWLSRLRAPLIMATTFVVVLGVGEVTAISVTGWESAKNHAVKMRDHTSPEMISSKRPGLPIAVVYRGEDQKRLTTRQRTELREQKPLTYGLGALILLGYAFALRKKTDVESFAFGYVPFFLLSTGTYYYHVARITLVMNHAYQLDGLRHRLSLAFLFALEIFSQITLAQRPGHELFWTGWLSWGLTAYSLVNMSWMMWESREPKSRTP